MALACVQSIDFTLASADVKHVLTSEKAYLKNTCSSPRLSLNLEIELEVELSLCPVTVQVNENVQKVLGSAIE